MLRTKLDPAEYFPEGSDLGARENEDAYQLLQREMAGIFHGWPS